jgi:hypothetical protein
MINAIISNKINIRMIMIIIYSCRRFFYFVAGFLVTAVLGSLKILYNFLGLGGRPRLAGALGASASTGFGFAGALGGSVDVTVGLATGLVADLAADLATGLATLTGFLTGDSESLLKSELLESIE